MRYVWDTEQPFGHAPYCASPVHNLAYYCSADPADPPTMRGEPSRAWREDHPAGADTRPTSLPPLPRRRRYTSLNAGAPD